MEEGLIPQDLFEADDILAIGGAFCNDVVMLRNTFCPKAIIHAVDPAHAPYEGFADIIYTKKYIQQVDPAIFDGDIVLAEMGHVLQECPSDEIKLYVLGAILEILEEKGYIIVTEEYARKGWKGFLDRNMHYVYNNHGFLDLFRHLINQKLNDGYWLKGSIGDYERLFQKAGFKVIVSRQYFRGTFISILQVP